MNNPLNFVQAMRNPQKFMQQMMNSPQIANNPIAKNAIELYQKGDEQGLNELANNLCREKGINRENFEKEILSKIGM